MPLIVPRDGVLALRFSASVDPQSVVADEIDGSGHVVSAGSIQVRTRDGRPVAARITTADARTLWLDPRTGGAPGFPPSPLALGPTGEALADPTGFLRIVLPRSGARVVRSASGRALAARADRLGDPATPIGFNPGNRLLDFVVQNGLLPTNETFNGFLPDRVPPRIVRTHGWSGQLDFSAGDAAGPSTIVDAGAAFSTRARLGAGEWAGARLILRPGQSREERREVASNTATALFTTAPFARPAQDGDEYRLERTERFEPDVGDPIDPDLFDPDNPENATNASLDSFVEVFELDALGNVVAGPTPFRDGAPPRSELRIRFSERIDPASCLPWETFRVVRLADEQETVSEVILDPTGTIATIRPALRDASSGTTDVVGWAPGTRTMQLVLATVPRTGDLAARMTPDEVRAFLDAGERGLTDLGGQPLGFRRGSWSAADPVVRYSALFTSSEAFGTQTNSPPVRSFGVIVHRMKGRPVIGYDPVLGESGVLFGDQAGLYRPLAEFNLLTNGVLAPQPIVFHTKVLDDVFPPPHGQFGRFRLGEGTPLFTPNPSPGPQPHDGARFQTVWRDVDCSPSRDALAGTLLDLYRVSWAPIGGNVTSDVYDNVSIHCAHSSFRPMTTSIGLALYPLSGLGQPFDYDSWTSLVDPAQPDLCPGACSLAHGPNHWDSLQTCVLPGTQYKVASTGLFVPPGDVNAFHPWPLFDVPFSYNNGDVPRAERDLRSLVNASFDCAGGSANPWYDDRTYNSDPNWDNSGGDSLLFEVRVHPQSTPISRQNGFSFAIGVLLDVRPYFRVLSVGKSGKPLDPDAVNGDVNARCAGNGGTTGNGDNFRYFSVFDYVKATSRVSSPFVAVFPADTFQPDYFPPIMIPSLDELPPGTSFRFEWEGASDPAGTGASGFSPSVDGADGRSHVAFRVTLAANSQSLVVPSFETIAIPYLRPFGD